MEKKFTAISGTLENYFIGYQVGDLVQSIVVGLRDFEFNSYGRLGIVIELVSSKYAAKIWWVGETEPKTVLFQNFKLISSGKKNKKS